MDGWVSERREGGRQKGKTDWCCSKLFQKDAGVVRDLYWRLRVGEGKSETDR